MSDSENYFNDPPVTRSKTPLPGIFRQNVSDASNVNNRTAPLVNRPAPASMKRKMEQAAHVKDLLKLCKPLSINLNRLSRQVITKRLKKREQQARIPKKKDRNRWQRGFVDKRKKPKSDKSTDNSSEMRPTHIWGCCRMIPFDRNRLKNQKRFAISNMKDSNLEISKNESVNDIPIPSTSKTSADNNLETSRDSEDDSITLNKEDTFVCRRTMPYIRKSCYKSILNFQNDSATQAGGSKNSPSPHQSSKISRIGPKISKIEDFHPRKSSNSDSHRHSESSELRTSNSVKKTDNVEVNDSRKSDDDDNFSWFNQTMWKSKRKHRSRRISSSDSSSDEMPKKKRKLETSEKKKEHNFSRSKTKPPQAHGIRTLCPPSCTNHSHHSNIFNFLYKKPKPMKELRVVLTRLENMTNDPDVIQWKNRGIKLERLEDDEATTQPEENLENQRFYLLHEDGSMSNAPIPQFYQFGNYNMDNQQNYVQINAYDGPVIDVSKFFNTAPQEGINQMYNPLNDEAAVRVDDPYETPIRVQTPVQRENPYQEISNKIENYPKVLLIRLETLVGALDSEYSASEIEILEEKYIDFLLNSNFSYDKQSQSFFQVYKRLQAKRIREKQIQEVFADQIDNLNDDDIDENDRIALAMNETDGDTSEVTGGETNTTEANHFADESDEEDENPLVIALENDKELNAIVDDWASDESVKSHADQVDQPPTHSTDSGSTVKKKQTSDSIEFVTCDSHPESEETRKPDFISCKFCRTSFQYLHQFSLHKASCHAKNKKPIKCDYCSNQYKSKKNWKLHVQLTHGVKDPTEKSGKSKTKAEKSSKTKSGPSSKTSPNSKVSNAKKKIPFVQKNLRCGVCSVTFETKESLFDHIYQHTERELQDAFNVATIRKRNQEIRNEVRETPKSKQKAAAENVEWANKYAQWKDSILCKNNGSEESSTSGQNAINSCEEITVCSSGSEDLRRSDKEKENVQSLSSSSRSSVIKNTKAAEKEAAAVVKPVTMCPCHSNDTSTLVNGDMQIEMVLLCEICQVLFRRSDCFEVHYRVNRLCNRDRSSRVPKLFCSCCKILLNTLPEMRRHLEKHAQVNRQGHVTFLCNICKVMFFGIGSLFYSHWFNHNKDVNFIASRYSFPKLSIVPCSNLANKVGNQTQKEEYLFIAEHVCRDCRIPFGSEIDLERHSCTGGVQSVQSAPPVHSTVIKVFCLVCNKMFANKKDYFLHELNINHMRSSKPEYVTIATNGGEKAHICAQCKTVRTTTEEMTAHWTYHRAWREKFICSFCPKVFDSNIDVVEEHCKNCTKDVNPYCRVSFELATYKCQPCNLYFETSQEAKEHNQICLRSQFSSNTESSNRQIASSVNSSLSANSQQVNSANAPQTSPKPPILRLTVPSSALSSVVTKTKFLNGSELIINGEILKATDLPSTSKSSNILSSILSQKTPVSPAPALNSISNSKDNNQVNSDVEVIDIISESSSNSDVSKQPPDSVVPKDMPMLTTIEETDEDPQKDVSKTKSVPSSPKKKNKKDSNPQKEKVASNKTKSSDLMGKSNLAMTVINPEFETLLTELEGLDGNRSKDPTRFWKHSKISSKETKRKTPSKEILKDPLQMDEELPTSDAGSISSKSEDVSIKSGDASTKSGSKSTDSPLPFEVVLLPGEENANSASGISTSQVDINSNKSVSTSSSTGKSASNASDSNPKNPTTDQNSASIIEEYIEYIMMDVASDNSTTQGKETIENSAPPKEKSPPAETVAPTRLRVRSLAELQEIKMHLCETCGKSFNNEKDFSAHVKDKNCSKSKPAPQPKQTSGANFETSFTHNSSGNTSSPRSMIPPLMPLSKTNNPPTVSNQIPRRHSGLNFGPKSNPEVNQTNSSINSNVHRSSAIQLPERTGGNTPQKRPSGAATRIQNVSHPPRHQTPTMIQHQGLPNSYVHRAPARICPSVNPQPGLIRSHPYQPPPNASSSLSCTTCFYTAKNLAEFSSHLLMHYMEQTTQENPTPIHENRNNHQENQQTDPNTSFQNSQIIASDIYGSSSDATSSTRRTWPSTSKYIYVCRLCNFQTDSKPVIREHEKHHLEGDSNLQQLQNQQMMQSTYQTHQRPIRSQSMVLAQTISPKGPTSGKTKDSDKGPIVLYASVSNDVFQCLLCNSFFFSAHEEFVRHLQTVHKQPQKDSSSNPNESICYVCDYCEPPQVFNAEVNLRRHMEFLHNHICHVCGQRCTSRDLLQTHTMSHQLNNQAQ